MNDAERLRLLMEVAGTTVYDEKKAESQLKMDENNSSIEKINEILNGIDDRLTELHGEKEELTEYQRLDRNRRAVEYALYDKELRKAREKLDEIERDRNDETEALSLLHEEARDTHDAVRRVEALMKTKMNAIRKNAIQMTALEADQTRATTLKTKLELECREMEESLRTGEEIQLANKSELANLADEIRKAKAELTDSVEPEYRNAAHTLSAIQNERDEAKKKIETLYAKQGRGRQFSSKEERNAYLRSHIEELTTAKDEKVASLAREQEKLSSLRRLLSNETESLSTLETERASKRTAQEGLSKQLEAKKRERVSLQDQRREQWRKSESSLEHLKESRDAAFRCESDMRKVMPRAAAMGTAALRTIVQQERLVAGEEYFGTVVENLELVDDKYQTAVEVAAQNSLFHVIVDSDATAARLMERLEENKLGRVTFLPLNRLRQDPVQYPDSSDVTPLISHCIKYQPVVENAMKHVFGRKLLARSVEAASKWSTRSGIDAITLDGDLCSSRGALSGGYVDPAASRLRAFSNQKAADDQLRLAESDHQDANRKAQSVDQAAANLMGEIQSLEAKHAELSHSLGELGTTKLRLEASTQHLRKVTEELEQVLLPGIENGVQSLSNEIGRLEAEMATDLTSTLSDQERTELSDFKEQMNLLSTRIGTESDRVGKLSIKRQKLESLLTDNLLKRQLELQNQSRTLVQQEGFGHPQHHEHPAQKEDALRQKRVELEDALGFAADIERSLLNSRSTDSSLRAELNGAKTRFEQFRATDMKNTRALEEAHEKAERLLNKVSDDIH